MLRGLEPGVVRALFEEFEWQAHGGQWVAAGDAGPSLSSAATPLLRSQGERGWRTWVMVAGRGFGKTRAGSEWVQLQAVPGARIALVAASMEEVERVMVEGPSGLIATAKALNPVEWTRTGGRVEWANGALGFAYSAAAGEALRGPEHHAAWCDELAKWPRQDVGRRDAWSNLQMGLRLGEHPQVVVTTTPREGSALLKAVLAAPDTVVTGGRTADNPHLPAAFVAAMEAQYGGTRLGRQELDGIFHEAPEGALWTPAMLDRTRWAAMEPWRAREKCVRIVVGVDPPAGLGTCGIIVAGRQDGVAFVLDDCSVSGASPGDWAKAVARAYERWDADRVVAETNMGGAMVKAVLTVRHRHLPVVPVRAAAGKCARAEPVAALFENHRAGMAGRFPLLEEELCRLVPGETPSPSPDRADAMVWALTSLMIGPRFGVPKVAMI